MRGLSAWLREYAAESLEQRAIEEQGWVGGELIRELGERGFCGLYVSKQYGGHRLSQTGYCRVFETLAQTDASLSVVLGVHQSIGYKGIVLFGTDEQKSRFPPKAPAPAESGAASAVGTGAGRPGAGAATAARGSAKASGSVRAARESRRGTQVRGGRADRTAGWLGRVQPANSRGPSAARLMAA